MGKRKPVNNKAKDGVENSGTTKQGKPSDGITQKMLIKRKMQERKSLKINKTLVFGIPAAVVLVISAAAFHWYNMMLLNHVRTPLDAPKLVDKNWTSDGANKFWGSYRSNLYFGLKTRSPSSPVFG